MSEATLLDSCAAEILRASSLGAALHIAAQYLRQITPATVYALFVYDNTADVLTCVSSIGDEQRLLDGLTVRLGERVTGWTAANHRTSVNSNASLDLAEIAGYFVPRLRSTISTPIVQGDAVLGVLTGYSSKHDAFGEGHSYAFEKIASTLVIRISTQPSSVPSNVVSFRTKA